MHLNILTSLNLHYLLNLFYNNYQQLKVLFIISNSQFFHLLEIMNNFLYNLISMLMVKFQPFYILILLNYHMVIKFLFLQRVLLIFPIILLLILVVKLLFLIINIYLLHSYMNQFIQSMLMLVILNLHFMHQYHHDIQYIL